MAELAPAFLTRLAAQIPIVLAIFAFRALPFAAYAVVTPRIARRNKLLVLLAFGSLVWLCARLSDTREQLLVRSPIALAYFLVCALGVFQLSAAFKARRITKLGLLSLLALVFLLLPALYGVAASVAAAIAIGWEIMLSAYSYCVDTAGMPEAPSRKECLFFLLVNPTLVYNERGERIAAPGLHVSGVLRATFGVIVMLGQDALQITASLAPEFAQHFPNPLAQLSAATRSVLYYSSQGLGLYFAHSGLASMQIGMMRLIGYQLPERYHYPLFAVSPQDFWRRWNIWLGAWAKRYVYFPVALQLGRRFRARAQLGKAAALCATFLLIGVLHDVVSYVSSLDRESAPFVLSSTLLFGLSALGFLAWLAVEALVAAAGLGALAAHRVLRMGLSLASWLLFARFTQFVLWLAIPGLSGQALPAGLMRELQRLGRLWP